MYLASTPSPYLLYQKKKKHKIPKIPLPLYKIRNLPFTLLHKNLIVPQIRFANSAKVLTISNLKHKEDEATTPPSLSRRWFRSIQSPPFRFTATKPPPYRILPPFFGGSPLKEADLFRSWRTRTGIRRRRDGEVRCKRRAT